MYVNNNAMLHMLLYAINAEWCETTELLDVFGDTICSKNQRYPSALLASCAESARLFASNRVHWQDAG